MEAGGGGEIKHSQPGIHQSQKLNEILKNSSFRCSRNILNHLEKAGCSITCCGSLSTLLAAGHLHLLGRPLKRQRERPEHSPAQVHVHKGGLWQVCLTTAAMVYTNKSAHHRWTANMQYLATLYCRWTCTGT